MYNLNLSLLCLTYTCLVVDLQKIKAKSYSKDDVATVAKRRELNDRLMLVERGFLDAEGIKGKEWFKHLVSKYKTLTFFFSI